MICKPLYRGLVYHSTAKCESTTVKFSIFCELSNFTKFFWESFPLYARLVEDNKVLVGERVVLDSWKKGEAGISRIRFPDFYDPVQKQRANTVTEDINWITNCCTGLRQPRVHMFKYKRLMERKAHTYRKKNGMVSSVDSHIND